GRAHRDDAARRRAARKRERAGRRLAACTAVELHAGAQAADGGRDGRLRDPLEEGRVRDEGKTGEAAGAARELRAPAGPRPAPALQRAGPPELRPDRAVLPEVGDELRGRERRRDSERDAALERIDVCLGGATRVLRRRDQERAFAAGIAGDEAPAVALVDERRGEERRR